MARPRSLTLRIHKYLAGNRVQSKDILITSLSGGGAVGAWHGGSDWVAGAGAEAGRGLRALKVKLPALTLHFRP